MKKKIVSEFEVNSSQRLLYPYISTPGGLAQWFADDVSVLSGKQLKFLIDGEEVLGKIVASRFNESIRIEYDDTETEEGVDYTNISLEVNDLTGTLYVVATDFTDFFTSDEEHYEMWEGMVDALKNIIGS